MLPNHTRIQELITGKEEPNDVGETTIVDAYQSALQGESLIVVCMQMQDIFEEFKEYEYSMFILGYAMGQKDFLDRLDGLDLEKVIKDDSESYH